MIGETDVVSGDNTRGEVNSPIEHRPPPDYKLPVGAYPRPGRDWLLESYSWDEGTGVARLYYRHRRNSAEKRTVDLPQPAAWLDRYGHVHAQSGWDDRPAIDYEAVRARYFDTIRSQSELARAGAYIR